MIRPRSGHYIVCGEWSNSVRYGWVYRRKGEIYVGSGLYDDGCYLSFLYGQYHSYLVPLFPPTQDTLEAMEEVVFHTEDFIKTLGKPGPNWQREKLQIKYEKEQLVYLTSILDKMKREVMKDE